jgi:hypothetical protein
MMKVLARHISQGEEGALSLTTNELGSMKGLPLNHCAGFRPSKTSGADLNSDGMLLIFSTCEIVCILNLHL